MSNNIFIVDDDKELTQALNNLFSESGYYISIVTNGKEAEQKLKTISFDLAILDMNMPGLDGVALLKIINQHYPNTKVVILTGYGKEYKEKVKELKYQAFLTKPFSAIELADVAKDVLEGKKIPEKEKLPLYNDPYIMPKAKLLFLDTDYYRLDCLRGYFSMPQHCGGQYEVETRCIIEADLLNPEKAEYIKNEAEKTLMLSRPDIVLGCADIYGFSTVGSEIYSKIKDSTYKPKDIIIYGEDIKVRGSYGTGIPGLKNVIKRLEQIYSGKPTVGDPILDKLGKAVRESAIKNNLYIKVKEPVRIPGP